MRVVTSAAIYELLLGLYRRSVKILITLALESAPPRICLSINCPVAAARLHSYALPLYLFIGSFFELYPRHRALISINKRSTGRRNREFNSRHDWNSLLTDDPRLQFARYSQDFFPQVGAFVCVCREGMNGKLNRKSQSDAIDVLQWTVA